MRILVSQNKEIPKNSCDKRTGSSRLISFSQMTCSFHFMFFCDSQMAQDLFFLNQAIIFRWHFKPSYQPHPYSNSAILTIQYALLYFYCKPIGLSGTVWSKPLQQFSGSCQRLGEKRQKNEKQGALTQRQVAGSSRYPVSNRRSKNVYRIEQLLGHFVNTDVNNQ